MEEIRARIVSVAPDRGVTECVDINDTVEWLTGFVLASLSAAAAAPSVERANVVSCLFGFSGDATAVASFSETVVTFADAFLIVGDLTLVFDGNLSKIKWKLIRGVFVVLNQFSTHRFSTLSS